MLILDHDTIQRQLESIIKEAGIQYDVYCDPAEDTKYHVVDGKSIKFWNIFPRSGDKLDIVMLRANRFLRPLGLLLSYHNFTPTVRTLSKAVVPQRNGGHITCDAYVDIPKPVISLLVKPLPKGFK